jgi:hypothetical protein
MVANFIHSVSVALVHAGRERLDISKLDRRPVVFFVDDEDGLRRVANRLLRKRGFDMIGAASAAEAAGPTGPPVFCNEYGSAAPSRVTERTEKGASILPSPLWRGKLVGKSR